MNTKQVDSPSLQLSQEQLLAFVRSMIGGGRGREDDDHPLPAGPWDPVIRVAVEKVSVFGPRPEPWRIALEGGHSFGDEVALNPQPLPPRYALLVAVARVVTSRAELFQELADAAAQAGAKQGIIIVGGYTSRFSDDWCGTGFKLKWPFPGPHPHWFPQELDGLDLLVLATQFQQASREAFSPDLRKNLANAGSKFVEAGMSRMQSGTARVSKSSGGA